MGKLSNNNDWFFDTAHGLSTEWRLLILTVCILGFYATSYADIRIYNDGAYVLDVYTIDNSKNEVYRFDIWSSQWKTLKQENYSGQKFLKLQAVWGNNVIFPIEDLQKKVVTCYGTTLSINCLITEQCTSLTKYQPVGQGSDYNDLCLNGNSLNNVKESWCNQWYFKAITGESCMCTANAYTPQQGCLAWGARITPSACNVCPKK